MLQLQIIHENTARVQAGLEKRGIANAAEAIAEIQQLDQRRKSTQTELDEVLRELNNISKQIGVLMREGRRDEAETVKKRTAELKERSKELKTAQDQIATDLQTALYQLPNIPNDNVPDGFTEEDNEVVHTVGEIPEASGRRASTLGFD